MKLAKLITTVLAFCSIALNIYSMDIRKIKVDVQDLPSVEKALESIEAVKISNNNWPSQHPYSPEVCFKVFHNGEYMVIKYFVTEESTRAEASEDGGKVWLDSCVECFISPESDNKYYNIEANCIGILHMSHRVIGGDVIYAEEDTYSMIKRYPSMKAEPFQLRDGERSWELMLIIPAKALFKDSITSWDGLDCAMNFYKCGDQTKRAHYLSWSPIALPNPMFHAPQFFGKVHFE
ncbi:MAG: hypothetical protein MJY83_00345 [Bacteroidales bacterium]|nr:hypothetical protein [Bacteroidales bacterium]